MIIVIFVILRFTNFDRIFMKKYIILVLLVLIACSSSGIRNYKYEEPNFVVKTDEKNGKPSINGAITWELFKQNANWSSAEPAYSPDYLLCRQIGKMFSSGEYFLLIFSGSWCKDSESQVPIIYKIIEKAEINAKYYQLIGIDREKKDILKIAEECKIKFAPTLIILHKGKEIERIEEFPVKSWEEDILKAVYK